MLGDRRGVFRRSITPLGLQPASRLQVIGGPVAQQHAFVGHLAQDSVLEQICATTGQGGLLGAKDHVASFQGIERFLYLGLLQRKAGYFVHLQDSAGPEIITKDGRLLQRHPLGFG